MNGLSDCMTMLPRFWQNAHDGETVMSEITLSIPDESLSLNETLGQLLSDAFGQRADT